MTDISVCFCIIRDGNVSKGGGSGGVISLEFGDSSVLTGVVCIFTGLDGSYLQPRAVLGNGANPLT